MLHNCFICRNATGFSDPTSYFSDSPFTVETSFMCYNISSPWREMYPSPINGESMIIQFPTFRCFVNGKGEMPFCGCKNFQKRSGVSDHILPKEY